VWKDHSGEKQSLPEYHNLVTWGGLAEFCSMNVKKGKPLYVEGYLKTRSWDGPEGSKIFRTEIVVENLVLLGPRDGADHHSDHGFDAHQDQPHTNHSAPVMEGEIPPA
jgi:single-strand DNA-binding protein